MRNHSDQHSKATKPNGNLQKSAKNDCREHVSDAMLSHQCYNNDSHRTSRPRDHSWSATKHGRQQPKKEGGIEPDDRGDSGDKRKRDSFRDQGKCNSETRKNVVPDVLLLRSEQIEHGLFFNKNVAAIIAKCQ